MSTVAEQTLARVRALSSSVPACTKASQVDAKATSPAAPVVRLSITAAAKQTGTSRDTIYRLYKAGFVRG